MLDINLKTPIDAVTEVGPWLNEHYRKCIWYLKWSGRKYSYRKCHLNWVGGMQGGSVFMCIELAAGWRRCDHENLCGWHVGERSGHDFILPGRFDIKKSFTEDPYPSVHLCSSNPLFCSTSRSFWVIKKNLIIFYTWGLLHVSVKQEDLVFDNPQGLIYLIVLCNQLTKLAFVHRECSRKSSSFYFLD